MIKRPPQHRADAAPQYITESDDAWDTERIERERAEMGTSEHPIDRYYSGATRYDLDAKHTIGGTTVTPRDYLREGATPTIFTLRRSGVALIRSQAIAVWGDDAKRVAALWQLASVGVSKISDWDLEGGAGGQPLTARDMESLHDCNGILPQTLGLAVFHAAAPLSDTEGKR